MRLFRRNALGIYGVYAVSIVSGLVVTPVVLHAIGDVEFGIWSFIGSITIYLSVLDFGVGPSIVRFGARARGAGDPEETSRLASVGLTLYAAIAVLSIPAGLAIAWLVPALVDTPDDVVWEARIATLLVVASLVARFPLGLFTNLLVAQQRWDVQNLGNAISIALYAALVVVLVPLGGGLVLLGALTLVATLVRLVIPLRWLRRELPGLRLRREYVTRAGVRELTSFSWSMFLLHVANKVVFSTDVVVVGIVLGPVAATIYAIPAKLFQLAFGLSSAATNLLFPAFAEEEGAGRAEAQRRLLLAGLRGGSAAAAFLALPLLLLPEQLVHAWVGDGYSGSTWVLVALAAVVFVHQPLTLLTQYLSARALQRPLARLLIVAVAANVVLSVALAWAVGAWGVAVATLVTDAAALVYAVAVLAARAAGISVRVLATAIARPFVPAVPVAALVLVGIGRLGGWDTILTLLPVGILWAVAGGLAIARFGLAAPERQALRRWLPVTRPSSPAAGSG
jgi:O-antigen/teichoic acid export membrane protein